jgi:hypothetical protein
MQSDESLGTLIREDLCKVADPICEDILRCIGTTAEWLITLPALQYHVALVGRQGAS